MLSHLDDDGPVRLDGVKLGVCEAMGLEIDEPKLGAFAGALNALDFPVQLLIRQHPPRLGRMREKLQQAQPEDLPPQTRAAAESLQTTTDRPGGPGRHPRPAPLRRLRVPPLRRAARVAWKGRSVRPPPQRPPASDVPRIGGPGRLTVRVRRGDVPSRRRSGRREMRVGESLVLVRSPPGQVAPLAPSFLQGLMAAGAPMDLAVHVGPIPAEQAARTLEWQKVRFESAQSLSFKRGRTMSPEAEIALEDVTRLRDEVQRGRERLFHSSLSVTLHAKDEASLKEMTQRAKAHFAATLGKLDPLAFRQREGLLVHPAPGPERRGGVAHPGHVQPCEAVSILAARPGHQERHPLRHRPAGLLPHRLRPLGRNTPEREHRRSRPLRRWQESFATKLGVLRGSDQRA